jgi:hypothetical protein
MSIPDLVSGFARYMVHSMQTMIDKAAMQGATIGIDTPDKYPIVLVEKNLLLKCQSLIWIRRRERSIL